MSIVVVSLVVVEMGVVVVVAAIVEPDNSEAMTCDANKQTNKQTNKNIKERRTMES